ncbi:MAG: hypothetical protein AAF990_17120 [Bacteroidota bacterium]
MHTRLLIAAFFLFSWTLQAQKERIPEQYDYFRYKKQLEAQIERKEGRDTTKDDDNEHFMRWDYFWKDRVDRYGDMREYPKKMAQRSFNRQGKTDEQLYACENGCGDCCFPSAWQNIGPEVTRQNMGKVHALWINPADEQHILAGAEAGLWKTIDGGQNWKNLTDFCFPGIGIADIAVQPDNDNVIYISTAYGNGASFSDHDYGYGLFKTTDGGSTWIHTLASTGSSPILKSASRVLVHPVDYSNVYALVGHEVYKSINFGGNWTSIFNTTQNPNELPLFDIEIIANNLTDEVYVTSKTRHAAYGCGTSIPDTYCWGCNYERRYTAKVWQFNSNRNNTAPASSLVDLTTTLPNYNPVTKMVALSFTSNSLNIGCQTNDNSCTQTQQINLYKKPVGSTTWTNTVYNTVSTNFCNITTVNYGFSFPFEVSAANDNVIYYGGLILNKSTNGGTSFSPLWCYWDFLNPALPFAGSHPDVRYMSIYRSRSSGDDVLFFGTDGGVSKSNDGGTTSLNLNGEGLDITQFYGISNSEILPNLIYGGTQDNGVFDNKIQSWRTYPYGDFYDAAVDRVNPQHAYSTMNASIVRETFNGGANWGYAGCPSGDNCAGERALYFDANNRFFFGGKNLWRRSGTSWVAITNLNSTDISGLDLSSDGNIAYIAYSRPNYQSGTPNSSFTKKVYKITNLNTTPIVSDITAGLEGVRWQGITDLACDASGNVVWVSFGNFWEGNKKVFRYQSGVWTEYGQGLDAIPVTSIEHYKGSDGLLFAGTDDGVYYRNNSLSEWQPFRCQLPRIIVTDLEINYELERLRAATYGRGLWETSLPAGETEVSCSGSSTMQGRVIPGSSAYTNLVNNQTTNVNRRNASVSIKLSDLCQGGGCCGTSGAEKVSWRIFRNGQTYAVGSGTNINFSAQFQIRIFGFVFRRFQYRIEITTQCGGYNCTPIVLNYTG